MERIARNRLREFREKARLTQQQLAERAGVHSVTISKLERSKINFSFDWAVKFAKALNINPLLIYGHAIKHLAIIQASIENEGKINGFTMKGYEESFDATEVQKSFELEFDLLPDAKWFLFRTSDFYPMFRIGDAVKFDTIKPDDVASLIGTISYVFIRRDTNPEMVGILSYGSKEGLFTLSGLRGEIERDIKADGFGRMTMAVYQPTISDPADPVDIFPDRDE